MRVLIEINDEYATLEAIEHDRIHAWPPKSNVDDGETTMVRLEDPRSVVALKTGELEIDFHDAAEVTIGRAGQTAPDAEVLEITPE